MANPFDQFDAPTASSGNPFDQFDAPAKSGLLDSAIDYVKQDFAGIPQRAGNLAAGLVRGAGSIGATLLAPVDMAKDAINGKGLSLESNRQRRADMDAGLRSMGADTDSTQFQVGKLAGEIAGTAGTGGVLANGVRAVSQAPRALSFADALASGGMQAGSGGNMLTRVIGGATTGGASAGLINPSDAKTGAEIGAAIPAGVKTAGLLGNALVKEISPEVASLYQKAQSLGIDVPADRLATSKPLNALASSLNYVPLSGRSATEDKLTSQLYKAVSRTFGQDSDNVTAALRKASSDLGGKFEQTLSSNAVKVDNQMLSDLAANEQTAINELGEDGTRVIKKQIDEMLSKGASGEIDGQAAYNIKKALDRIGNRNSPEAYYARELKKTLMGALNRSLGPQEAAEFAKVRQQYGNMLDIEGLAQNGAEGGISIGRLANMKNINNPDLQDLADISAQFLKSRENAHGAAQRVTLGLLGGTTAGATGTLPILAGTMAAGRIANMALNSDMTKNLLLNRPLVTNKLAAVAGNPLLRASGVATSTNP